MKGLNIMIKDTSKQMAKVAVEALKEKKDMM